MDNRKNMTVSELELAALNIRKNLLDLAVIQNIHIGGDLSISDVMTVLWQYQMEYDPQRPTWEKRDRFILSKGHSSAVMALNQAAIGCFSVEDVMHEYAMDEGRFSMHPCSLINPFVEISTGSLGHGLPIATGVASALYMKGNYSNRVYTIMGDGEQAEGSIWEAVMCASMKKLGNLVAILDYNKIEGDGFIEDISGLGDIPDKYRHCGWLVYEINGNNVYEIKETFDNLPSPSSDKPILIACHTVKGKGVDYMENQVRWHTGKLELEQAEEAKKRLEEKYAERWNISVR